MSDDTLALRVLPGNQNHHLWDNNGTWFIHYTVHRPNYTKARIRQSLGTKSLDAARRLRDKRLSALGSANQPLNQLLDTPAAKAQHQSMTKTGRFWRGWTVGNSDFRQAKPAHKDN